MNEIKSEIEKLVSVVIPVFNRQELLNKAIELLTKQTYKNFEVIVVDDGSTLPIVVNEGNIIDVKLFRYSKNRGPGYARQIGRANAKGEYICYLDSDDFWSENFLEECVHVMNVNPSTGMVFSNTIVVKLGVEVGRRVGDIIPESIVPSIFQTYNRSWSTSSCLWRSQVSLSNHWVELRNNEDYIHDMYSSKINNRVKKVENAFTYKNQSAEGRIQREGLEVAKALQVMLKINNLDSYKGLSYFTLNRVYKFNITIKLKNIGSYFLVPFKEFGFKIYSYIYFFGALIFNGIFNVKNNTIKLWILKLKV